MIIPENYSQANLRFVWAATGQTAEVAFGVSNPGTGFTAAQVASKVGNAINAGDLRTVMVATIAVTDILVKNGPNDTGASAIDGTDHTGTLTGQGVQPNTALLVTKATGFGGRRGRGRMYWPGIQDAVIDDYGNLTSGTAATFQTKFDAFLTSLDTAGIPMVLLHDSPTPSPYPVSSLIVQTKVATQRRRLRK